MQRVTCINVTGRVFLKCFLSYILFIFKQKACLAAIIVVALKNLCMEVSVIPRIWKKSKIEAVKKDVFLYSTFIYLNYFSSINIKPVNSQQKQSEEKLFSRG